MRVIFIHIIVSGILIKENIILLSVIELPLFMNLNNDKKDKLIIRLIIINILLVITVGLLIKTSLNLVHNLEKTRIDNTFLINTSQ